MLHVAICALCAPPLRLLRVLHSVLLFRLLMYARRVVPAASSALVCGCVGVLVCLRALCVRASGPSASVPQRRQAVSLHTASDGGRCSRPRGQQGIRDHPCAVPGVCCSPCVRCGHRHLSARAGLHVARVHSRCSRRGSGSRIGVNISTSTVNVDNSTNNSATNNSVSCSVINSVFDYSDNNSEGLQ
jgi:hypothetical protein